MRLKISYVIISNTEQYAAEQARLEQLGAYGAAALLGHKGHAEFLQARRDAAREARGGEGGGSGSSSSERSSSGARYDSMGSVDWGSSKGMAISRSYAVSNDMGWATKQPDLMRMGKPALQALHESHLQEDGYSALNNKSSGMGFDAPTVVQGAGFMKRNSINYNEAAKSARDVYKHKSMTPEERAEWKASVGGALKSKNPTEDAASKERIHSNADKLRQVHPEMKPELDRAEQRFKTNKKAGLHAAAKGADAAAKGADAAAKAQHAKVKATGSEIRAQTAGTDAAAKNAKANAAERSVAENRQAAKKDLTL